MQRDKLSADRLRELLHYDPETGIFTWRVDRTVTAKAGCVAGWIDSDGYVKISVDGIVYLAHRIAHLYMTGAFPDHQIDHRKGNRADNRWKELRPATQPENARNCGLSPRNTSGFKGVCWYKPTRKWMASIRYSGRQKNLGYFETPDRAHEFYCLAAELVHGEFANFG